MQSLNGNTFGDSALCTAQISKQADFFNHMRSSECSTTMVTFRQIAKQQQQQQHKTIRD